jgi:signal transduction histidine kinase
MAMFAHVSGWLRRHKWFVDLVLMFPVLALSLLIRARYVGLTTDGYPREIPLGIHLFMAFGSCLPLVFRRRWPRTIFAIIALVAFVQWLLGVNLAVSDLAVLIAMYTVAAECTFRWALAASLVAEFGVFLAVFSMVRTEHLRAEWRSTIPSTVTIAAIVLSGLYVNTRRKYTVSLEERAKRLERERDAQAEAAAAAERARIAREMHDVIAHSISVMVIQADGAAWQVETDAARARRAMEAIGATGRQALTEMRRMLGVLREGGGAALAPQPGVDQLGDLVEQMRTAGLPIRLVSEGTPAPLPAGLELTIYRIVQEALTNVLKHAGPAATARVEIHYGGQLIEVRVNDDGRGATFSDGRGHGLVGMRERAAVYGGSISAGPVAGGGFEVLARLPVKEEVKA